MARGGRQVRSKAQTEESAALAAFVRELTRPLTVAQLGDRFGTVAKSTLWAEWRNGTKDIPPEALAEVIRAARVPADRRRELTKKARMLCAKAEAARSGRGRLVPAPHRPAERALTAESGTVEVYEALALARREQLNAERALRTTEQTVWILLRVIGELKPRVAEMEDRLRSLGGQDPGRVREERDRAREQLARAEEDLARAEAELAETRRLEAWWWKKAEEYRRRLGEHAAQDRAGGRPDGGEETLDDYEVILERVRARLDATARRTRLLDGPQGGSVPPDPAGLPRPVLAERGGSGGAEAPDRAGGSAPSSLRSRLLAAARARRGWNVSVAVTALACVVAGLALLPSLFQNPGSAAPQLPRLTRSALSLATALQDERDLSAGPLTQGARNNPAVKTTRENTDKALRQFLKGSKSTEETAPTGVRANVVLVIHEMNELDRIRRSAYSTPDYVAQTANSYNQLITSLLDLPADMAQASGDTSAIHRSRMLSALTTATEKFSMQRAILAAALANPNGPLLTDGDRYVARTASQSEEGALRRFTEFRRAQGSSGATTDVDFNASEIRKAEMFRERAVTSELGIRKGSFSYKEWMHASTARFNAMKNTQDKLLTQLTRGPGELPSS